MSRISEIPRRDWKPLLPLVKPAVTQLLRVPGSTEELFDMQAISIAEAGFHGRGFFVIEVGGGKTLTSAAIPVVRRAKRPLILLQGGKLKDTMKELDEYREHWRLHPKGVLQVHSYSKLSQIQHRPRVRPDGTVDHKGAFLWLLRPDVIVLDEFHSLKDPNSTRTQVFTEFMEEFPTTEVYAMTATASSDHFNEYAHILRWTHKEHAPVPEPERVKEWLYCLKGYEDAAVDYATFSTHMGTKCRDAESSCAAFLSRLSSTPAVIISDNTFQGTKLTIQPRYVTVPPEIANAIADVRLTYTAPDGWMLTNGGDFDVDEETGRGAEAWELERQLANTGGYQRHEPWPDDAYMRARSDWCKFVRSTVRCTAYKSELEVRLACEAGYLESFQAYEQWFKVHKPTFTINKVPEFLSDFMVHDCVDWATKYAKWGGVIWVQHPDFGERLSQYTGWRYFHHKGRCGKTSISEAPGTEVIIASIGSCGTGFNLPQWNRAYVTCPMGSSIGWNQLPGRHHRNRQKRDVEIWYAVACKANVDSLNHAFDKSHNVLAQTGVSYKLLTADFTLPKSQGSGPVWVKP